MKTFCITITALLLSSVLYAQADLVNAIPGPPAIMKQEYVTKYIKAVDSIQKMANDKITLYKAENEAAIKNIDKSKIAQQYQSYGQPGGGNTNFAQQMMSAQQVALNDQKLLDATIATLKKRKDSIDQACKNDMVTFNDQYQNWLNKCAGAVTKEGESACNVMLSQLNGTRKSLLEKYYFGAGMYASYINAYISYVTPLYINAAKSQADYSELTMMGATVPHKEDLAYAELADDLVIMIHDAYNIGAGLWPLEE